MKLPRYRAVIVASALALVLVPAVASPALAASGTASVKVPAGTTLNVADQDVNLETLLTSSGQAAKLSFAVQYSAFQGAPAIFQAFESGDVDVALVGDAGIIPPQEANQQFVVVAATESTGNGFALEGAPGENITSVKQLRGKKIGYSAGTAYQSYVLQLLKENGLSPSDVNLVNLPSTSLASAVQAGDIDVAPTENPLQAEYRAEYPTAKVIPTPYSALDFIVATKSAVDNRAKAAAIGAYLQRLQQAYAWVSTHQKAFITAYYGTILKLPASIIPSLVSGAAPTRFVPIGPSVIDRQQETTNLFTQVGAVPTHLNVSKVFTTKFNKYIETAQK